MISAEMEGLVEMHREAMISYCIARIEVPCDERIVEKRLETTETLNATIREYNNLMRHIAGEPIYALEAANQKIESLKKRLEQTTHKLTKSDRDMLDRELNSLKQEREELISSLKHMLEKEAEKGQGPVARESARVGKELESGNVDPAMRYFIEKRLSTESSMQAAMDARIRGIEESIATAKTSLQATEVSEILGKLNQIFLEMQEIKPEINVSCPR